MHPVLRSAIAAGTARFTAGARIAFAMLRMFANELRATLARVIAYSAALAAFGLGIAEFASRGAVVTQAAQPPDWVEVIRPLPAFATIIPELDGARYSIWRHASGTGRKDILTFGEAGGATAMVEIHRPGVTEQADDGDITASISQLRLSGPRVSPNTIETKFGDVTVEAFTDDAPDGARSCLRFMRGYEEPRLEISGWFCNAGLEMVDHGMIACALDRLSLLSSGSEPKLATLFARAELKRSFCGQRSVFLAATPKRTDWIDATRDPKLRRAAEF
jgi:hypothetical protein